MKCIRCGAEFDGALGQCPYCAQPAGEPAQGGQAGGPAQGGSPYGQSPYGQGGSPYSQNPYGQGGSPYSQNPYGQGGSPYGQSPYGQGGSPYGQSPYAQGGSSYGQSPYGQEQAAAANGGYAAPPPPKAPRAKLSLPTILIAVGVVAAAIIAAVVMMNLRRESQYQEQMELGYRYLGQGQYEEAILAFNAAIEIQPRHAEPYAGLGDAYTAQGEFDQAVSSYNQAVTLDSSLGDAYVGLANAYIEMGDAAAAVGVLDRGIQGTQGSNMIQSNDMSQWREALQETTGTSVLRGTVAEYLPGGGSGSLSEARVGLYVNTEAQPRLVQVVKTDEEGVFVFEGLAGGSYTLRIEAPGHIGLETVQTVGEGTDAYAELFVLIPEPEESEGETAPDQTGNDRERVFSMTITNAINGSGVADGLVILRSGWNNRDGETCTEAKKTDEYGAVSFTGLSYGYYTAEVRVSDFAPAYHNVAVVPDGYAAEWSLPVTPTLAMGETRIVLTWNDLPYDLDAHLESRSFHVFYSNQNYYDSAGLHRVNLDLDDTSSYGPETISIYRNLREECTYYVYDYSNGGRKTSTALSTSGATVRVYQASGLVATYHVPTDCQGDTWTVFTMREDGSIVTVNTVS